MSMTRRQALASAGAAAITSGLAKPAIAVNEPIRLGYLPALTGPSSSTGIGINRGIQLAVQELNAAGGIGGRQIELITRDTQSDPTKAVNGAAELTHGEKVGVVFGPVNSGESLAVVPLLARASTPQVHPCWVDSLTDPKKYPMCFRNGPTNQQIGAAANRYVVEVLKRKKVAVISDTTGYGTASVNA
jgi:branched-chain amino acid transport system substrate-binding protein